MRKINKVSEPLFDWGGPWTEIKLDAFENYVNSYLTIMNSQKKKYNGWPTTIYFDGFAGSGKRNSDKVKPEDLFADYLIEEEVKIYQGSAERILRLQQKFDYYYFVDDDKSSIKLLEQKLKERELVTSNFYFRPDDVNNQLAILSEFIDSQKAALVMLDPFGMQIDWSSIELLKNKRVDLWILIPSGVIINRFLDRKGKLIFIKKLESYFGLSEDKIRKKFYETSIIETLFGPETINTKTNDSIKKIAEVYIEKLKQIFKFVSEEPLKLFNTRNFPIYHFVFASNNKTAYNIANQIIDKKRK
jgi:three-Cys-motif partner protein